MEAEIAADIGNEVERRIPRSRGVFFKSRCGLTDKHVAAISDTRMSPGGRGFCLKALE